ncbi:MAG TPA: helix-turn-helix domain-containing protein, partial [Phycisphaerae bacterium]|nr:helix-turn-helix domain-containing protein [Phycisphaerae bacterium]HRR86619.1 helix-turn-helix domain-containing protein [Phycisphaerae bacterium]
TTYSNRRNLCTFRTTLANAIEHACVLCRNDTITARDLPASVRAASISHLACDDSPVVPLAVAERALIARALQAAGGNKSLAAAMLQIDRRRLYRKIRAYGLHINRQ